jgi:hypothetical protein
VRPLSLELSHFRGLPLLRFASSIGVVCSSTRVVCSVVVGSLAIGSLAIGSLAIGSSRLASSV